MSRQIVAEAAEPRQAGKTMDDRSEPESAVATSVAREQQAGSRRLRPSG